MTDQPKRGDVVGPDLAALAATFSAALRGWRLDAGLTQAQLAERPVSARRP